MKKVLWIGPIVHPSEVSKFAGISPAANKWQISLIECLQSIGWELTILSYIPNSIFPKGKFHVPPFRGKKTNFKTRQVGYFNVPFIRPLSLLKNHLSALEWEKDFDVVITYNNSFQNVKIGNYLKQKKCLWVSIVAEEEYVEGPDLTVFLSYGYFRKASIHNKMHLDGGVENFIGSEVYNLNKKVLLFSGALNKWTGIEKFALSFSRLNIPGCELHIYGKGNSAIINELVIGQSNIVMKGFVSDLTLEEACRNAFAFINPRPTDILGGETNFPSKVLEYLRYGKPILSSKTAGMAPYYENLLFYYDPNNPESLVKEIDKLLSVNADDKNALNKKIEDFCIEHSWDNQAARLIKEIEKVWDITDPLQ